MRRTVQLEQEAVEVSNAAAALPRIYQLPPKEGREVLEKAQDAPVFLYPAQISCIRVNTGQWGEIPVYVVIPECLRSPKLPYPRNACAGTGGKNRLYRNFSGIYPLSRGTLSCCIRAMLQHTFHAAGAALQ